MNIKLTRRKFLHSASVAAASVPLARLARAENGLVKKPVTAPGSYAGTETRYGGVCEMCFWRCQLVGKVRNGRLIKLEGNPKSIENGKSICARGNAGIQLLYDPDRLKYPLKNVGERGAPKWKRISWEEALDETASRLKEIQKKYGPHAVALFPHGASAFYPLQYFEFTGTPNISEASFYQCRGVRDMAYMSTFGFAPGENVDMANAKAILLVGTHLGENVHVSHLKQYLKGLENGAKLIVLDPRFSAAASKAHIWVAIKPGTDTAFLQAVMKRLIDTGKYDKEFVAKSCLGFEELKESLAEATPEWAAKTCDVPKEQILQVADLLGANLPNVSIHPGRHTTWYGNDFQRLRAQACLTAILGAYGVPGGLIQPKGVKLGKASWGHGVFAEDCDLSTFWPFHPPGTPTEAIRETTLTGKPYPIKAWIAWGQNPIQTLPNQPETIAALKKVDFVMVTDIMPMDITMYADILLPGKSYLERYDYVKTGMQWNPADKPQQFVTARMPLVEPMFERRDSVWIVNELAKRMGYGDKIPVASIEEHVEIRLEPAGLSIAKLKEMEGIFIKEGTSPYAEAGQRAFEFSTDSEKVELYSEQIDDNEFSPVPTYIPTGEVPAGYARLVYGRSPVHSFSRTQNNTWLHHEMPENPVWLNDSVAAKQGLKDGDRVMLINQDGVKSRNSTILKVTPGIRADTVYLAHGYGAMNPELTVGKGQGIDDQGLITKFGIDPETGATGMRTNFVKVVKA
ncbi:MAG: molybdopterin-dependent oxidoreductase [Proteobacteria bacterium]|nr:molybdopterin-dependent oxidoreductase [Pseudomonadota bacterium]MBU1687203.1 molybdopterin-dependent oxidoreductase [Pseudomonadota bacterium]